MLPKVGIYVDLKDNRMCYVLDQNPNGYDRNKPQEFTALFLDGTTEVLTSSDLHPRYFR